VALAVLALVSGLLVVALHNDARFDDSAGRKARAAVADLTAAALSLAQTSGIRYTGRYLDDNGDAVTVDARVTNEGWTRANLVRDDDKIAVLSNGPRTYLKADKDYWSAHGAPRDTLAEYAKRWVRVPTEELGFDLARSVSPGVLGADLLLAVERDEVTVGPVVTVSGRQVRELTTRYAKVYLTTTGPPEVVRITSRRPGRGGSGGGVGETVPTRVRTPFDPEQFELDLVSLSSDEVTDLFSELEKRVKDLKKSVDSEVRFALTGRIKLDPCTVSGCTATVSMSNNVSSTSPYLVVSQPVVAVITIRMTLDKRTVKTCAPTRSMKPNGSATVKCRTRYTVPADGMTHHVEAVAKAVARAGVDADLREMTKDLKAERDGGPPPAPDKADDLGRTWLPCDPGDVEDEHATCSNDALRIHKQLGGVTRTIRPPRGLGTLGGYRGYDADWAQHLVVVKDGRVYDPWTSRYGEPTDVYKARWEWGGVLDFGF
jgi:type II secretory pathway pseudopilin PulG